MKTLPLFSLYEYKNTNKPEWSNPSFCVTFPKIIAELQNIIDTIESKSFSDLSTNYSQLFIKNSKKMSNSLLTVAYIVASVLFIFSLGGLSNPETARQGNVYGISGMLIAFIATALSYQFTGYLTLIGAIAPGIIIGAVLAYRVAMTSMPELVATLHSFVGLAAVLVGIANYLAPDPNIIGVEETIH